MDITGTDRSKSHKGSAEANTIRAKGGSDTVSGLEGNDTILGGDGRDTLKGGSGDDVLYGHSEADTGAGAGLIKTSVLANIGAGAVSLVSAPGDNGFVYALNKDNGVVSRIDLTTGAKATFLNIGNSQFSGGGERGVLNVAFHPDYASNGRFFIYLTNPAGDIEVREYARSSNPAVASASMVKKIITIPHPGEDNHNGGAMAFGSDGLLYLGLGDGGGGNDPGENAQDKNELLGKILRIDINGDDFASASRNYSIPDDNPFVGQDGRDEIFALGVRNPWRMSFDPATGDLYIGDVGQQAREEVDYIAGGTGAGTNFGWDFREGTIEGPSTGGAEPFTDPIIDYDRNVGRTITGGVVYRGGGDFSGAYFYADFSSNRVFSLKVVDGHVEDAIERTDQFSGAPLSSITSFGTDAAGRVYAVIYGGDIIRLTPTAAAGDGADSLEGGDGNDKLFGGWGEDTLQGGNDNDTLRGGEGQDTLDGGLGRDMATYSGTTAALKVTLNGATTVSVLADGVREDRIRSIEGVAGGQGNDTITGDSLNNYLRGGNGADSVSGAAGRDTIEGGGGADALAGGLDADKFLFRSSIATADTITDFITASDRIVLYTSIFATLNVDTDGTIANAQFHRSAAGVAHDATDRIIYDTDSGELFYDADGNEDGAAVMIATLTGAPVVAGTDIFVV